MNEDVEKLLEKYPFLEYRNYFSDDVKRNLEERIQYNYWTFWDGCGWESIRKTFLRKVFEEYDKFTDEEKSNFLISDTKEKYGELRVYVYGGNETIDELISILEMISRWTCFYCGNMPRNSRGKRIIWNTRGYILPHCKKCAKDKLKIKNKINYILYELKDVNKKFIKYCSESNQKFKYEYTDLGDWLKLDKITKC